MKQQNLFFLKVGGYMTLNNILSIIREYDECDVKNCKNCSLNVFVDLIPAEHNGGQAVRGSVCDLITELNADTLRKITKLLK